METIDMSYETIDDMVMLPITQRFIKDYVEAVCSDWYNRYHIVKYDGKLDKEIIARRLLGMNNRYVIATWDGELIGGVALAINEEVFNGDIEISYFVNPAFQNKGIATKVISYICKRLTEHDNDGYISIYVSVMQENKSSLAVAEHCGFIEECKHKYEGTDEIIVRMKYKK